MIDMMAWPLIAWVVACICLIVIGHELTHYIAWLPIATNIEYSFREAYIEAQHPDTPFARKWAAIAGISPMIVATAIVLALLATGWDPMASAHHLVASWAIFIYGISGGKSDFDALAYLLGMKERNATD